MGTTVKLSRDDEPLLTLTYPVTPEAAAEQLDDVTVRLANGEENLGDLVADVASDSFDSADDLRDELYEYLLESAMGEAGQSEGEGCRRPRDRPTAPATTARIPPLKYAAGPTYGHGILRRVRLDDAQRRRAVGV